MNRFTFRNSIRVLLIVALFLGTTIITSLGATMNPASAQAFMANRANSKETVVVRGASHVVMVSHPDAVAEVIEHAAIAQ